ncbi:MAG: DnaA/Hda family protein [Fibrobacter sp.]|nr:DnaA/Hda family protein [Fibrobacter sp.]
MENIVSLSDVVVSPWQSVLEQVRQVCNNFGAVFFDAVGYEGFSDGYANLTVPDKFRETWLNSHYGDLLRKLFSQVLGSDFIDYKIRLLEPSEKPVENGAARPELQVARPVAKPVVKPVARRFPRLKLYSNYTFENFVEGESNSTALRACEAVVENPGDKGLNPLLIYGASGLGKTHLLQSIAARLLSTKRNCRIVYRQAYDFLRECCAIYDALRLKKFDEANELEAKFEECYKQCDVLLIDDLQLLESGVKTQKRLAALIRKFRDENKQVVLTCDRHPSSFKRLEEGMKPQKNSPIPYLSANLLTNIGDCVAIGLAEPDINTRMGLIRKKSQDIPFASKDREEICRFLSMPPRANVRLIEGILNWLKAMHTLNGVELDLDCVKQLLYSPKNEMAAFTVKNISETVAMTFNTDLTSLSSNRQDKAASLPRKVAMFLCRELTSESLENVGKFFNRDYATVIAAIKSLTCQMDKDEALARKVKDIRYMLES